MARVGPVRHRGEIQQATATVNSFGEHVVTEASWSTVATRWVELRPIKGREFFDSARVNADVTHILRLRYFSGLTPKHRLKIGARKFNIFSVHNPDGRKVWHELECREVV
jgi:SPP1 family predicted phage head-tail adaptor